VAILKREHDGIIKIESLLVKSSDEGEIPEVALRGATHIPSLKVASGNIFVDKTTPSPYNPRQINKHNEL
jgi:hypothetical protein